MCELVKEYKMKNREIEYKVLTKIKKEKNRIKELEANIEYPQKKTKNKIARFQLQKMLIW